MCFFQTIKYAWGNTSNPQHFFCSDCLRDKYECALLRPGKLPFCPKKIEYKSIPFTDSCPDNSDHEDISESEDEYCVPCDDVPSDDEEDGDNGYGNHGSDDGYEYSGEQSYCNGYDSNEADYDDKEGEHDDFWS